MYFILFILLAVPLLAQEEPANPSPSPEVSATPAESPAPEASPTPEASPSASPGESAAPAAKKGDEDVIPLPPDAGPADAAIVSETEVPALSKPAADQSLPDSAFADPNAVIPNDVSGTSPAPSGPSAGEIERKLKIRYKEVRTQVEKDPAVVSLKQQADSAKTFEDERAALREYYRLLFKKMKKIDKDLVDKCDAMEKAYLMRLAQVRSEPTIPLNPPPTPEPLGN